MASSLPPTSEDDAAQPVAQTGKAVQIVVAEVVVAKLAADVAARTPGVARLEPGVGGVLTQFGRWGREQVTGVPELPHEGVRAQLDAGGARVYLDVVTEGTWSTHLVAHRLRDAVADAIPRLLGVSVVEVGVTVLSIDTAAGLTVHTSDGEHHDEVNAARTGSGIDQDPETIPGRTGTGHHRSAEPPTHGLGNRAASSPARQPRRCLTRTPRHRRAPPGERPNKSWRRSWRRSTVCAWPPGCPTPPPDTDLRPAVLGRARGHRGPHRGRHRRDRDRGTADTASGRCRGSRPRRAPRHRVERRADPAGRRRPRPRPPARPLDHVRGVDHWRGRPGAVRFGPGAVSSWSTVDGHDLRGRGPMVIRLGPIHLACCEGGSRTMSTPTSSTSASSGSTSAGPAASGSSSSPQVATTASAVPAPGQGLETAHGKTTIADTVVSKIAGLAAREVHGVHGMGGGAARSARSAIGFRGPGPARVRAWPSRSASARPRST